MSRIPVGLQMYTVRDVCEQNFVGALRQVADIGYEGVELAGSYGLNAEVLRDILVDVNLKCIGSHTSLMTSIRWQRFIRRLIVIMSEVPRCRPQDFLPIATVSWLRQNIVMTLVQH